MEYQSPLYIVRRVFTTGYGLHVIHMTVRSLGLMQDPDFPDKTSEWIATCLLGS